MDCKLARKELQKNARIRCRLGFAGHEVRSRAYLDASEVPFGLQELLPSWCWTFGSQNEHIAGQLEAWKMAILGQKSARIRCRLGFAGYKVRSKAHVDISWGSVAKKTLFCRARRVLGRCRSDSNLPTAPRAGAVGREREGINPPPY